MRDIDADKVSALKEIQAVIDETPKDRGRRGANARDKARRVWVKQSDGVNRASIRKEMALAPRAVREFKRAQMKHQQEITEMRQHPLSSVAFDFSPVARRSLRNQLKTLRKARQ